jgi:hypothetical protein
MFSLLRKPLLALLLIQFSLLATLGEWLHHQSHCDPSGSCSSGCCDAHCGASANGGPAHLAHGGERTLRAAVSSRLALAADQSHHDCFVCQFFAASWSACLAAEPASQPELAGLSVSPGKPIARLAFSFAPHSPRGPPRI